MSYMLRRIPFRQTKEGVLKCQSEKLKEDIGMVKLVKSTRAKELRRKQPDRDEL